MSTRFPDLPIYSGFDRPGRIEADIFELEVEGEIPLHLQGTFYRVAPEPHPSVHVGEHVRGTNTLAALLRVSQD